MIDRLITVLQDQGLLLSDHEIDAGSEAQSLLHDEDIADALWLAARLGGATIRVEADRADETENADTTALMRVIDDPTTPETPQPLVSAYMPQVKPPTISTDATPEQGLPIQVQAAPALANALDVGRSLRPLMRKVASLTRSQLDEMATVNQIAERDIWVPILQPLPERWFDLELVIEASPFSFIWQETLDEFQHLLECQGAFRNVRTWYVHRDETDQPRLATQKQFTAAEPNLPCRSPKELIDTSGRRLVLVVSDCRSLLWRQGSFYDWLASWSQHGPMAIVQLLPEWLWNQTELDLGFAVQVGGLMPGIPNTKLYARGLPSRTEIAPANQLTVPVVTLSAGALKQWALVVAAVGQQRTPARLFDLAWVKDPQRESPPGMIQPQSPQERLELFLATASPIAQRLACRMAAVPVELPVVHLIQQALLPEVESVHIAEVYASGLLMAVPPMRHPQRYDFATGVRGLLNDMTPIDQTLAVFEALSQRIARTLGFEIKSFTALLAPKSSWSPTDQAAILPFAQIATEVLHRLGGDYAKLAQMVERDAQGHAGWLQPPEPEASWPELQTEAFEIVTIALGSPDEADSIALESFEFDIATIEPASQQRQGFWQGLFQRQQPSRDEWVVRRRRGRAQQWVELLGDDLSLEMVAIPAGQFLMGSPEDEPESYGDEKPQHEVTVPAFFMAKYPVTQAQWRFVASLPQINCELQPNPSRFDGDKHPVERVSWFEAVEFCARLSAHTGRAYRLPSEAEWEYGCRAGTTTPFHFGEIITTDVANYNGNVTYNGSPKGEYRQQTTPVDQFQVANAFGLCEMHGNVREWCLDHWHSSYEGALGDGSAWLDADAEENQARVHRGGSWVGDPGDCRSASRLYNSPRVSFYNVGFRVVVLAPRALA